MRLERLIQNSLMKENRKLRNQSKRWRIVKLINKIGLNWLISVVVWINPWNSRAKTEFHWFKPEIIQANSVNLLRFIAAFFIPGSINNKLKELMQLNWRNSVCWLINSSWLKPEWAANESLNASKQQTNWNRKQTKFRMKFHSNCWRQQLEFNWITEFEVWFPFQFEFACLRNHSISAIKLNQSLKSIQTPKVWVWLIQFQDWLI